MKVESPVSTAEGRRSRVHVSVSRSWPASLQLRSRALTGTFSQRDDLIGSDATEFFVAAVGPNDIDFFHASRGAETKVSARIVAAQVTLRWVDPCDLPATA